MCVLVCVLWGECCARWDDAPPLVTTPPLVFPTSLGVHAGPSQPADGCRFAPFPPWTRGQTHQPELFIKSSGFPFQSLSARPRDEHKGSLHAWHAPPTLNKGSGRQLAAEARTQRDERGTTGVVRLPPPPFYRRRLQRGDVFPCNETRCKINK